LSIVFEIEFEQHEVALARFSCLSAGVNWTGSWIRVSVTRLSCVGVVVSL
jgi:hypothetical protein